MAEKTTAEIFREEKENIEKAFYAKIREAAAILNTKIAQDIAQLSPWGAGVQSILTVISDPNQPWQVFNLMPILPPTEGEN